MKYLQSSGPLKSLGEALCELAGDESGLSTVEYALLVALLAVAAIWAYRNLGIATSDLASDSTQQLPGGGDVPPAPRATE